MRRAGTDGPKGLVGMTKAPGSIALLFWELPVGALNRRQSDYRRGNGNPVEVYLLSILCEDGQGRRSRVRDVEPCALIMLYSGLCLIFFIRTWCDGSLMQTWRVLSWKQMADSVGLYGHVDKAVRSGRLCSG